MSDKANWQCEECQQWNLAKAEKCMQCCKLRTRVFNTRGYRPACARLPRLSAKQITSLFDHLISPPAN